MTRFGSVPTGAIGREASSAVTPRAHIFIPSLRSAAPGAQAGPVTDNLPVNLPGQKPAMSRHVKHDRIFSEIFSEVVI